MLQLKKKCLGLGLPPPLRRGCLGLSEGDRVGVPRVGGVRRWGGASRQWFKTLRPQERGLPHTTAELQRSPGGTKKSPHHVRNVCSHWLTFSPRLPGLDEEGGCRHVFPNTPALQPPPLTTGSHSLHSPRRLSCMGKHRAFLGDLLYHFVALIALPSVHTHPAQPPS